MDIQFYNKKKQFALKYYFVNPEITNGKLHFHIQAVIFNTDTEENDPWIEDNGLIIGKSEKLLGPFNFGIWHRDIVRAGWTASE